MLRYIRLTAAKAAHVFGFRAHTNCIGIIRIHRYSRHQKGNQHKTIAGHICVRRVQQEGDATTE